MRKKWNCWNRMDYALDFIIKTMKSTFLTEYLTWNSCCYRWRNPKKCVKFGVASPIITLRGSNSICVEFGCPKPSLQSSNKPKPFIACSPTQNVIEAPTFCSSQFHISDRVLAVLALITVWCWGYWVTTTLCIIISDCRLWFPGTEFSVDSVLHDRILCKL